jgi:tripartite-type tricarboxylate transporter receptor subunit TctC
MTKFLHRRQFLHLAASAVALPAVLRVALAEAYPSRSPHIVVGFPAGGASDISARLIAPWLSERLGQTFIIENRAGASSNIATEAVVRAPSDGYTLLLATCINTINASLFQKLNFDFIRDMSSVAFIAYTPLLVVVHPSIPVHNIPELIAYAKANPRKLNLGSAGFGTPIHVAGELFKLRTGTDMVQVQYQGGAPAVADLLGGQVQVMFDVMSECIEHVKAGKLRALAVTSATPSDAVPNVPVLADFLPGFEATFWSGVCAPKNTPVEIIKTLNSHINTAISDPAIKARFTELGSTVFPPASSEQFAQFIDQEARKWGEVVKAAGMKAE